MEVLIPKLGEQVANLSSESKNRPSRSESSSSDSISFAKNSLSNEAMVRYNIEQLKEIGMEF